MNNSGVQNYLNTLIFCVVAKTITVLVLGLLVFPAVRRYAMFLLTIEVGLVLIIFHAMWKISSYDKRMAKEAEQIRTSSMNAVSCPDYYTRGVDEENVNVICTNKYATPDGRLEYKFKTDASIDVIPIDDIFRKKTLEDACKLVVTDTDMYNSIPWTDIKSKCDVI
jgi:hypothetical protein